MNCDRIARAYRWMEYAGFGRELERRRFAFLGEVKDARRALVLGDGDGRFLARLLRGNSRVQADYVDLSAGMLELARRRAGEERVAYHRGDARTFPLGAAQYDLIATHFFLDCLGSHDLESLIHRAGAAAKPEAVWLVSEFRDRNILWTRLWIGGLYVLFRVTTGLATRRLIDHRPFLAAQGFRLQREETSRFGLLVSELWVRPPL